MALSLAFTCGKFVSTYVNMTLIWPFFNLSRLVLTLLFSVWSQNKGRFSLK